MCVCERAYIFSHELFRSAYIFRLGEQRRKINPREWYMSLMIAIPRETVSNYAIDVRTISIYYLTGGLALKDNDQCGRYCVNDLADVSKMRLRVAGCSRDRFVITTLCMSPGDYDLPNDVQTSNENGLARARICRTLRAVERNYINTANTNNNGVVPWYAIHHNFSLHKNRTLIYFLYSQTNKYIIAFD